MLDELISAEIGSEPFLLIGHSFGGHLARGIAARRPDQVAGLELICPMVAPNTAEPHTVVRVADQPNELIDAGQLDDYLGYFVVHTAATATRGSRGSPARPKPSSITSTPSASSRTSTSSTPSAAG